MFESELGRVVVTILAFLGGTFLLAGIIYTVIRLIIAWLTKGVRDETD